MSQASSTGSGDDLQATMEAILQRLDKLNTIEERIGALEAHEKSVIERSPTCAKALSGGATAPLWVLSIT
jgi:hypothetical protein